MICPKTGLIEKASFTRYLYYRLATLVPFSGAVIAITRYSETTYWTLAYIGMCLLHAAIVYSIKCPRCPHYKNGERIQKCRMIWGVPKIFEKKSGPEGQMVGIYIPIAILTLTFFSGLLVTVSKGTVAALFLILGGVGGIDSVA